MTEAESVATTTAPAPGENAAVSEAWVAAVRWVYPAALAAVVSIWFLALRAPLWLDETLSYWQVSGGFAKVWSRSGLMPSSIGYLYTLWVAKSILGTKEIALKIPSMIAQAGAVYFLFRGARELYDRETALLAAIFFAITNNVVFAATDARPYACALLATNVAILAFIRWMKQPAVGRAMWFGVAAVGILYFHYLFGTILPAFAIYYLIARGRFLKEDLRQLGAMTATFGLLIVPLMIRVAILYHTRETHIIQPMRHPIFMALNVLAPKHVLIGFLGIALAAAVVRKITLPGRKDVPQVFLFPLLALLPAGMLFAISAVTPMHLVIPRYFTVVAPGSALLWAWLTMRIDSVILRQIFCVGIVAVTVFETYSSPLSRKHELSFKQTHAFINANVGADDAPVLVCSAFIESNFEELPTDPKSENALNSQIDYYPIHAPVIFMPMDINDEAKRIGEAALRAAAERHQRFLALAAPTSYQTINWLAGNDHGAFTARVIAEFDEIVVVEFSPVARVE
jgi:hypothetical protein